MKAEIANALTEAARAGPFYRVARNALGDMRVDRTPANHANPTGIVTNETEASWGEQDRRSPGRTRLVTRWELIIEFAYEVDAEDFEDRLSSKDIYLQNFGRLRLTRANYTHPRPGAGGSVLNYVFDFAPTGV